MTDNRKKHCTNCNSLEDVKNNECSSCGQEEFEKVTYHCRGCGKLEYNPEDGSECQDCGGTFHLGVVVNGRESFKIVEDDGPNRAGDIIDIS